ncbi:hypothetical protein HMPREF1544_06416 [Mucor circinelloides 1006PhL]|uniref:ENTH domain-containing protein n=1 Tax=Mucor circinelloides f. circinelloides (strain 1006PhL) TaxID=1220926 RepID=S2K3L1_MUCC1|nr:hypothetical protein HMPREF1544_06416 [Mucor circinelloides 1006PhL]
MNSLSNFQIPDAWEVKDVVNKLKSVVLNYTEMEAKVHEATNNEPWGASSTLMQEIAQGTYNYQYFNEIMPTVYRRFTEKESKQWRQIYKALVLLEYLIKNGSERVVDDARSHVSMIKVMRNFYYIDDKGKDEGLNVRNRAKEIVELLGNTDKIRSERKLAKKNRNKYTGVGSDSSGGMRSMGLGGMSSSSGYGGSRYVGFGSDSYSGGGGISFNGDALSFGEETPYPHQSGRYDEDDEDQGGYRSDSNEDSFASSSKNATTDDFDTKQSNDDDWGDFTWGEPAASTVETKSNNNILDDDFADFQHAVADDEPVQAAPKKSQQQDLFDLLGDDSSSSTPAAPSAVNPQQQSFHLFETKQPMVPSSQQQQQQQQQQQPKQEGKKVETSTPTGMWAQASNFVSLDSLGKKSSNNTQTTGPSMNALKNTSVQADWNNWASNNQTKPATPATKTSSAFDDLLF